MCKLACLQVHVRPDGPEGGEPLQHAMLHVATQLALRPAALGLHEGGHRQPGLPSVAARLGGGVRGRVRGHVTRRLHGGRGAAQLQRQPSAAAEAHLQLPRAAR